MERRSVLAESVTPMTERKKVGIAKEETEAGEHLKAGCGEPAQGCPARSSRGKQGVSWAEADSEKPGVSY